MFPWTQWLCPNYSVSITVPRNQPQIYPLQSSLCYLSFLCCPVCRLQKSFSHQLRNFMHFATTSFIYPAGKLRCWQWLLSLYAVLSLKSCPLMLLWQGCLTGGTRTACGPWEVKLRPWGLGPAKLPPFPPPDARAVTVSGASELLLPPLGAVSCLHPGEQGSAATSMGSRGWTQDHMWKGFRDGGNRTPHEIAPIGGGGGGYESEHCSGGVGEGGGGYHTCILQWGGRGRRALHCSGARYSGEVAAMGAWCSGGGRGVHEAQWPMA